MLRQLLDIFNTDKILRMPDMEKTDLFLRILPPVSLNSSEIRSKLNYFCSEVFYATNELFLFMELILYAHFCRHCSGENGAKPLKLSSFIGLLVSVNSEKMILHNHSFKDHTENQ